MFKELFPSPLKVGSEAPAFCLQDQNLKTHRLQDYRGRWVVLFFYPKDETFFCTKEACSFRDAKDDFDPEISVLLGISTDSVESHKSFAERHRLPFPLLSDFTRNVCREYGVLLPLGIASRVTYIINPDGKVAEVMQWANWFRYGQSVAERIKRLSAAQPTT